MRYHQMFDVKLPAHNTNKSRFKAVEKGFRKKGNTKKRERRRQSLLL